jgi:hypothetical protein
VSLSPGNRETQENMDSHAGLPTSDVSKELVGVLDFQVAEIGGCPSQTSTINTMLQLVPNGCTDTRTIKK